MSKLWTDASRFSVNSLLKKRITKEDDVPVMQDGQPLNPYNEIQILLGHQDIVNILKVIDDVRLASSADDNIVIIWDVENGDQLHCLEGHTRPVTSMLVHQQSKSKDEEYVPVLITGSSDKTIRIWHCDKGVCLNTIQDHGSTVKCLVKIKQDFVFCSGGQDLCLWDVHGKLICEEKRPYPDTDVHTILLLKNARLVVAASKPSLVVYSITNVSEKKELRKLHHLLQAHREDIKCLINVSEECFASASLDGEIITWSSNSLEQLKRFNKVSEYEGLYHVFPFSVQHMLVFDDRFIFAAIGAGFSVFDTVSGKCVASRKSAHHSKVSHMEFLTERSMLATCSQDGTVRLWRSSHQTMSGASSSIEYFLGKNLKGKIGLPVEPQLLGECLGHSGGVHTIANFGDEGFATCASDGLIILWKDGLRQRQKRMELATSLLFSPSGDNDNI